MAATRRYPRSPWLALALALLPLTSACSFFRGEDEIDPVAAAVAGEDGKDKDKSGAAAADAPGKSGKGAKPQSVTIEEYELKLARLWARVDELEEEQYRQKEKIRVLEKGATLGLVPEELKKPKEASPPPPPTPTPKEGPQPKAPPADEADAKAAAESGPKGIAASEQAHYKEMLAVAHDQFKSGRYGRAIVEFDKIGKEFGDDVAGGMHRYWIAKSWAALKEYNTARQILSDLVADLPTSPWVPRAKLELARVEWRLGLQDTALKRFREVIDQHPYEDAAEMAKMELEALDKKL
jgi:TolA-binding protein